MTLPLYVKQKHTATKEAAYTGQLVIYGVEVTANDSNGDVNLCDALTDGDEDDLSYSVLNGDTLIFDYTNLGGVIFNTGLTVYLSANTSVIIWTDVVQVPT